jgi:NitT/TauT family transport system ATP-binding protein
MALVQLAGVSKVYRSMRGANYEAVRDFSLEIEPGEFFCLLGTSGCGKTTVLNMVAGFERASAGDIRIAGRMRGIARAEREATARRYLDLVGLGGQERKHPTELSGGMKQRIQIARVLANEPQMLLMDEPFAALDAHTRSAMQRELLSIVRKTGKTVLFITHDIDEAIILASKIGVMHAGPASKLKGVIDVRLTEAERDRTHDRFVEVYRQVHEMIRDEVAISLHRAH